MADSAITKWIARPGVSFATRYGLALASVTGAVLLELLFRYFNLPHPFTAFALSAFATTFWYAGTKPGIVAVLLLSLIRGFIVEEATSSPDTGVGLPVQQADQIFKGFFTTKPQGTGMGLSISHSIVESHGERLWAADSTARGANLYFTLPTKAEVRE